MQRFLCPVCGDYGVFNEVTDVWECDTCSYTLDHDLAEAWDANYPDMYLFDDHEEYNDEEIPYNEEECY